MLDSSMSVNNNGPAQAPEKHLGGAHARNASMQVQLVNGQYQTN